MNPRLLIPLIMNPRYITGVFSAAICLSDHIRAYSFPRIMNTRLFIPLIMNPRIFISAVNETAIIHSALNESALTHRRVFRGYLPRLNNVPESLYSTSLYTVLPHDMCIEYVKEMN